MDGHHEIELAQNVSRPATGLFARLLARLLARLRAWAPPPDWDPHPLGSERDEEGQ